MSNAIKVLQRRLGQVKSKKENLQLPLTAEERKVCRGRRRTACGLEVLLMLPREGPLLPGDQLSDMDNSITVQVTAALEALLRVEASSELELLQAAYHLGNRHVAVELHKKELLLLDDDVMAVMLKGRGLLVQRCFQSFDPEDGAYQLHYKAQR